MQSYEMVVKEVHCQLSYQRSFLNYRMWLLTYLNLDWQQSLLATSSNLIQKQHTTITKFGPEYFVCFNCFNFF